MFKFPNAIPAIDSMQTAGAQGPPVCSQAHSAAGSIISAKGDRAAGSTMYYPVQCEGGLFSIGDPHISQGDGEISGTAIESSLDVLFQVVLRKDSSFPSPLLETPNYWIVHGFDEDLNIAMKKTAVDMLGLLTGHLGLSRNDAYSLMSVAADFGITQVVDGRQGTHVRIPRSIFAGRGSIREPEAP